MTFPGFNNSKKRGTISRGDFDRDGVRNRKDCEPLNFRKQDGGGEFKKQPKNKFGVVYPPAYNLSDEDIEDIMDSDEDPTDFF